MSESKTSILLFHINREYPKHSQNKLLHTQKKRRTPYIPPKSKAANKEAYSFDAVKTNLLIFIFNFKRIKFKNYKSCPCAFKRHFQS